MNKLITLSFIPKPYKELLLAIVITLIGADFFYKLMNGNLRWTLYLLAGSAVLGVLFIIRNPPLQLAAVMAVLIFCEDTMISRRYPFRPFIPYLGFGISLIFALIVFFSFLYHRQGTWSLGSFKPLWIAFLSAVIISAIIGGFGDDDLMTENIRDFQIYYAEFFLFFCIGLVAFKNASDIKKFFFIMLLFGGLIALAHIYCLQTGTNLASIRNREGVELRDVSKVWRYGGFFGNPNIMGTFYAMFMPVGILLFSETKRLKGMLVAGLMIVMSLSLVFTGSRGPLLFTLVNSMMAFFCMKKKPQTIILLMLFLLIIFSLTYMILFKYFSDFSERSLGRFSEKGLEADDARLEVWRHSLGLIRENPLGIGLSVKNFILASRGQVQLPNAHNLYVQMTINTGVFGLMIFLTILGKTIILNAKAFLKTKDLNSKVALACLFFSMSGFLMCGTVQQLFAGGFKLNHIFGLILGISASFSYQVLKKRGKEIHLSLKGRRSETVIQDKK